MRYLLVVLAFATLFTTANAQKKPAKKEQVPTQKEMEEMSKAMEESMANMSEEDKKMMDSMGIKLPDMKSLQKTAEFAAVNAGNGDVLVPKRDEARIALIPKTQLTKTSLPAYLQTIRQKLESYFPQSIVGKTNELYQAAQKQNARSAGVTGVGCWAFGKPGPALLLLGRACTSDPSDLNQLNNFAAMLSMCGGEQLAIPILNFLNKQNPKNSTILNNLAHAWFGLGDVVNASKYIDSTLRLCAWHPQANQIKAAIEESKGNHEGAVKAMKQAISHMYTSEKERELNDLGYKLKPEDILWTPPRKGDELGLSKFHWPAFPKNVEESKVLQPEWEEFRGQCNKLLSALSAEGVELQAAYQKSYQERLMHDMNAPKTGARSLMLFANVVPKAEAKLRPRIDELIRQEADDPIGEANTKLQGFLDSLNDRTGKEMKALEKKWQGKIGEGIGLPEAYCKEKDAISNRFLADANNMVETVFKKYRDRVYARINEMANYNLYRSFPEEFAFNLNIARREWLTVLKSPPVVFRSPAECGSAGDIQNKTMTPLPDFDEVNCNQKTTTNLVFGSIRTECGRTIAEIEIDFVKLGWETKSADREVNRNFLDEFQRCTIEVSAGKSKSFGEGPLQLQTSIGATGFLEFDRTGLQDAGVKIGADVSVGSNVLDTKVETDIGEVNAGPNEPSASLGGVNATISINSGFTTGASGILKGFKP